MKVCSSRRRRSAFVCAAGWPAAHRRRMDLASRPRVSRPALARDIPSRARGRRRLDRTRGLSDSSPPLSCAMLLRTFTVRPGAATVLEPLTTQRAVSAAATTNPPAALTVHRSVSAWPATSFTETTSRSIHRLAQARPWPRHRHSLGRLERCRHHGLVNAAAGSAMCFKIPPQRVQCASNRSTNGAPRRLGAPSAIHGVCGQIMRARRRG